MLVTKLDLIRRGSNTRNRGQHLVVLRPLAFEVDIAGSGSAIDPKASQYPCL